METYIPRSESHRTVRWSLDHLQAGTLSQSSRIPQIQANKHNHISCHDPTSSRTSYPEKDFDRFSFLPRSPSRHNLLSRYIPNLVGILGISSFHTLIHANLVHKYSVLSFDRKYHDLHTLLSWSEQYRSRSENRSTVCARDMFSVSNHLLSIHQSTYIFEILHRDHDRSIVSCRMHLSIRLGEA